MVHIDDPLNRERLAELLDRDGYSKDHYSLYGAHAGDAFVIDNRPGAWVVFYSERGGEEQLRSHHTEDSACRDLLERLRRYVQPQ